MSVSASGLLTRKTACRYLVENDKHSARARLEVIVASGAFNSPQLLQLSGIGPAPVLRSHGIAVIADAAGVGDALNDHFADRIILRCRNPITLNDAMRS
jgi:choline dehydrogenase